MALKGLNTHLINKGTTISKTGACGVLFSDIYMTGRVQRISVATSGVNLICHDSKPLGHVENLQ